VFTALEATCILAHGPLIDSLAARNLNILDRLSNLVFLRREVLYQSENIYSQNSCISTEYPVIPTLIQSILSFIAVADRLVYWYRYSLPEYHPCASRTTMEHQLEYDEDYNFGSQSVSCASSAGSFSTASSFTGPHTPTSGRSSPQQGTMSLDIESIHCSTGVGYDLTPPASAFSGYFHSEVKNDIQPLLDYDIAAHQSRKASVATTNMEFDFNDMFGAMPPHSSTIDSTHPHVFGSQGYPDQLSSSPYMPTPSFPLGTTACDISSMWAYAGESSMSPFDRHDPSALASPTRHLFAGNGRRRLNLDEVQSRTSALQRAQRGTTKLHARKEKRPQDDMWPTVIKYKSGAYKCNAPECAGQKTYKRQEHLKRHILS
jgi:hypothetical protein